MLGRTQEVVRMRGFSVFAIAIVISCNAASAYIEELKAPELVSASAVIARIRIVKTYAIQPANPAQVAPLPIQYRNAAQAQVLSLIKGQHPGPKIAIEYNTGFTCPNVRYVVGEDCLVFLAKQKNGRYCTVNYCNGKYRIEGAVLSSWQGRERVPLVQVFSQLRGLSAKQPASKH